MDDEDDDTGKVEEGGEDYVEVDDVEADDSQVTDDVSYREGEDLANGDAHGA